MRVFLTALAVTTLAGALPAHAADPELHVASIAAGPDVVSVTCDTSSYPADTYPCELVVDVGWDDCEEVATTAYGVGPCRLTARGPLVASPGLDGTGACGIYPEGAIALPNESMTITFDSQRDEPAFHVETVGSVDLVQRTTVVHGVVSSTLHWSVRIEAAWLGMTQPDTNAGVLTETV